jgi:hypothetical protein
MMYELVVRFVPHPYPVGSWDILWEFMSNWNNSAALDEELLQMRGGKKGISVYFLFDDEEEAMMYKLSHRWPGAT